jgi:hypothetical protein
MKPQESLHGVQLIVTSKLALEAVAIRRASTKTSL